MLELQKWVIRVYLQKFLDSRVLIAKTARDLPHFLEFSYAILHGLLTFLSFGVEILILQRFVVLDFFLLDSTTSISPSHGSYVPVLSVTLDIRKN